MQLERPLTEEEADNLLQMQSSRYLYDVEHPYSAGIPAGYASWEEFWLGSVTEFVRTLHDSIQSVKPWVRLSPAALGKYRWGSWQGYGTVYQDAALWYNEGYVDQLTPMHYHWTSGSSFYDMLNGGTEHMRLRNFSVGKVLLMPQLKKDQIHVMDADTARFFFHTEHYYGAALAEIEEQLKQLDTMLRQPDISILLDSDVSGEGSTGGN